MAKQSLLFIWMFIFGSCVFAQELDESSVSPAAIRKLKTLYPDASKIIWEKEGTSYVADFFTKTNGIQAYFDVTGNLLKTAVEIDTAYFPKIALYYVTETFPSYRIVGGQKITDNTGRVRWNLVTKKGEFLFDKDGKLIR